MTLFFIKEIKARTRQNEQTLDYMASEDSARRLHLSNIMRDLAYLPKWNSMTVIVQTGFKLRSLLVAIPEWSYLYDKAQLFF